MFWTKVKGTNSLEMPSILSYSHVKNLWNFFPWKHSWQPCMLKKHFFFFVIALEELIPHMNHQVLEVLLPFLSFIHSIDNGKGHYMLMLMLDPMYQNMWLVNYLFAFWSHCALVVEYEKPLLLPLLLEVYKLLMLNKVEGLDEFISFVNLQDLI